MPDIQKEPWICEICGQTMTRIKHQGPGIADFWKCEPCESAASAQPVPPSDDDPVEAMERLIGLDPPRKNPAAPSSVLTLSAEPKCPKCGGPIVDSHGHGFYCPKPTCKWGWEVELDGSPLQPPERPVLPVPPTLKEACVNAAKALGLEHTIIKPGKSAAEVIEYWVRSASPEAPAAPIEICGEWEYANNDRAQCQLPKRHEGGCHWEFLENRADAMLAPAVTKDK